MIRRKHFKPGDLVSNFLASDYNAIVDEIHRLANLSVTAPLSLSEGPTGRVLALDTNQPIWATLSGSSSPYSFTEAIPQAGDTWVTGYHSGTSNAYEINGHAGLGGKRVLLRATEANDWRFAWIGYITTCNWTFTVRDACANALQSGCLVELYQSAVLIASCTTNGSGVCTLDVPAGSYDVVVTPPTGSQFATNTSTLSHTCAQSTTITLALATGHTCANCGPCTVYPDVLHLTWNHAGGTGVAYPDDTLTRGATFGGFNAVWYGASTYQDPNFPTPNSCQLVITCTGTGVGSYTVQSRLTTPPNSLFGLNNIAGGTTSCVPFSVTNANADTSKTDSSKWSVVG